MLYLLFYQFCFQDLPRLVFLSIIESTTHSHTGQLATVPVIVDDPLQGKISKIEKNVRLQNILFSLVLIFSHR